MRQLDPLLRPYSVHFGPRALGLLGSLPPDVVNALHPRLEQLAQAASLTQGLSTAAPFRDLPTPLRLKLDGWDVVYEADRDARQITVTDFVPASAEDAR